MPAETHQHGLSTGPDDVLTLLSALLGDGVLDAPDHATVHSLGVDDHGIGALWDTVREEFGERSMGPAGDTDELDPAMTISAAATTMARLLAWECDTGAG